MRRVSRSSIPARRLPLRRRILAKLGTHPQLRRSKPRANEPRIPHRPRPRYPRPHAPRVRARSSRQPRPGEAHRPMPQSASPVQVAQAGSGRSFSEARKQAHLGTHAGGGQSRAARVPSRRVRVRSQAARAHHRLMQTTRSRRRPRSDQRPRERRTSPWWREPPTAPRSAPAARSSQPPRRPNPARRPPGRSGGCARQGRRARSRGRPRRQTSSRAQTFAVRKRVPTQSSRPLPHRAIRLRHQRRQLTATPPCRVHRRQPSRPRGPSNRPQIPARG